jgi:hypothetical protein
MNEQKACIEPTSSQRALDEVKKQNEKTEARELLKLNSYKAKREQDGHKNADRQDGRRHAACLGLELLAKRLTRQRHLDTIGQLQIQQKKGYDKPLDELAQKAGKVLAKLLPSGVFADEAEATGWAYQHLPLTAARHQQVINCDRHAKMAKQITTANTAFWVSFSKGVAAGTGTNSTADEQEIIRLGEDRT